MAKVYLNKKDNSKLNSLISLEEVLLKNSDKNRARILSSYFKTGKGGYGEGDIFLGLTVVEQRKIAKDFVYLELSELQKLLNSKYHEFRFCALVILRHKFDKGSLSDKEKIINFYLKNIPNINNWDLVDTSSYHILGSFLYDKDRSILYKLAKSSNLWAKRIAIISTLYFIKKGDLVDTFKLSKDLLKDKHDLMHKAVGWMLREAGKINEDALKKFLLDNRDNISRTTWRYAIEKFNNKDRVFFMSI